MNNALLITLLILFLFYRDIKRNIEEIILDLLKIILCPISLIYKLIFKIFKIK